MASVRREAIIERCADDVWALAGDPNRLHEWFPGIVACTVEGGIEGTYRGATRTITTGTGLTMPEEILTVDPVLRRFQYRLRAPFVTHHTGTIDVFDLGNGRSLVSYSTDCEPDVGALVIGGATGGALSELRRQLEGG